MGWNRPKENGEAVSRPLQKRSGDRFPFRGAIAGLLVVLGAAVAAWWLWPAGETRQDAASTVKPTRIKEVKPAAAPKPEAEPEKKEEVVIGSRGLPIRTYGKKIHKDENGVWRFETGQRVPDPNRPTEKLQIKPQGTPPIFEYSSENEIAAIMDLTPGDMILEGEYGEDFIVDFRKSFEKEIKASAEDSDYVKDMKDAVIEVKKDLLARLNRGEDIAKYLTETRNDLHNLHQYREELRKQVVDLLDDGESVADSDVPDLIGAANAMLREKGIKELEDNEFVRQALILERKEMEKESERSEENE